MGNKQQMLIERRQKVMKFFENRPGEWFSADTVGKQFGMTRNMALEDIRWCQANTVGGEIVSMRGSGYMFREELPVNKNSEGYSDPTAAEAIEAVVNEIMFGKPEKIGYMSRLDKPVPPLAIRGEVWEAECSNGFTDLVLIVNWYGGDNYSCLKLFECQKSRMVAGNPYEQFITYMGVTYVTDIRKVTSRPVKYLKKKVFDAPESLVTDICDAIAVFFMSPSMKIDTEQLSLREQELDERADELGRREKELDKLLKLPLVPREKYDEKLITVLKTKVKVYEQLIFGHALEENDG